MFRLNVYITETQVVLITTRLKFITSRWSLLTCMRSRVPFSSRSRFSGCSPVRSTTYIRWRPILARRTSIYWLQLDMLSAFEPNTRSRRGIIVTPSALCGLCTSQDSRSHRHFLPKLLLAKNCEGWSAFHKLLLSLLKFLAPFLEESDLQLAARDLYKGTLHLLLVLLHGSSADTASAYVMPSFTVVFSSGISSSAHYPSP